MEGFVVRFTKSEVKSIIIHANPSSSKLFRVKSFRSPGGGGGDNRKLEPRCFHEADSKYISAPGSLVELRCHLATLSTVGAIRLRR